MFLNLVIVVSVICSLIAIIYAIAKNNWIKRMPVGNEEIMRISGYISDGAQAFLKREYIVLIPFTIIVALFLAVGNTGTLRLQSISFLVGAFASALTGYFGMQTATKANSRTAWAALEGLNPALKVAFTGGSVMGMMVVGLALLGISAIIGLFSFIFGSSFTDLNGTIFPLLTGFGLGASSIALFARVGGGIFTKAADVGADLVGKVEVGIPEDDPRNPAVIADNVGDNVGDVAGMGADLFESYVGVIIGCIILGANMAVPDEMRIRFALLPILLAGFGILASIIGTFFVKAKEGSSPQKALNKGSFIASILSALFIYPIVNIVLGGYVVEGGFGAIEISLSAVIGLVSGTLIGLITEYYTGTDWKPVKEIEKACITGPATTIISGIGVGMLSTFFPILTISGALIGSFLLAGFYGIGIAALGMLLTLGIQLSVDAYGPIADNAGGLAVMSAMKSSVRKVTDQLDAVGNTTAAIGKGFAIGSAALTAIILISAFTQSVGIEEGTLSVTNALVMTGLFLGGTIPFLFSALSMQAIGVSASAMIEEVRRQFREKPGILNNTEVPNYRACVDISTQTALKKMIFPGVIAIISPILIGFTFGIEMLVGFLVGATLSGVLLAIFMANAGGAWDNAKKRIEASEVGKATDMHKAAVVGDTVGDPFKDTAGPSLNTLIKLMAIIALVIAPMLKTFWG
ncbi:MAG: sodium-translocating pyrophosphatase [Candidatus Cloacimonetes bacterium]|nr:sodium-translocating pyrophosphatase [Candidatus Cloacimonadota bacterium]